MRPKTVSRFNRPERDTSGIVLPEFVLYASLQHLPIDLKAGKYGAGSTHEPLVTTFTGMSNQLVEDCFRAFTRDAVRLSLAFPRDMSQVPSITVAAETMNPTGFMLGDDAGEIDEETIDATENEILTPSGGAVGGETIFYLKNRPAIGPTLDLKITRSSVDIPLVAVCGDFGAESTGNVTLASALQAGDVLTAVSYAYRTLPGGRYYSTIFEFNHVIFIDTLNPLMTSVLTGLVWREMMVRKATMEAAGLSDLKFSRRSLSLWDQVQPPLGFRAEIAVAGTVSWVAYEAIDPIRYWHVNLDAAVSGEEDIVEMSGSLESFGLPFTDE